MVAHFRNIIIAAIFSQTAAVLAEVDSSWKITPFVACMQKACPAFPNGICGQGVVMDCHNQANGGKSKRALIEATPAAKDSLEVRGFPDLQPAPASDCAQTTLPKNFLLNVDVPLDAQKYCDTMKTDLLATGAGYINQDFSTAVTKSANELHGNKALVLSLVLSAYPPALAAFKTVQGVDTAVVTACVAAVKALTQKRTGCTADIDWYNAGKAHGETSTGAVPGNIDIISQGVSWLSLTASYLAPASGS